jgi:hypothetical protein
MSNDGFQGASSKPQTAEHGKRNKLAASNAFTNNDFQMQQVAINNQLGDKTLNMVMTAPHGNLTAGVTTPNYNAGIQFPTATPFTQRSSAIVNVMRKRNKTPNYGTKPQRIRKEFYGT